MRHWRLMNFLVIITIFFLHASLSAQDQQWSGSIKGGVLFPGTVTIDPPGWDVDTETGWIINAKADALMSPKFSLGALIGFAGTSAEDSNDGTSIFNIGATMKAWFQMQNGWYLRPGILLSYQSITGDFDDVTGFNAGAFVEIASPLKNKYSAIVGELGFISQPAGGNSDADVTFAPIFYIQIGYEFGG